MNGSSANNGDAVIQGEVEVAQSVPMHPMQRMAAKHLLKSQQANAPVTILGEADADGLVEIKGDLANESFDRTGQKISLTHILIALTAAALGRHPRLNAERVENNLLVFAEINIGVALALSDGNLIVPVIKQANTLSLEQIATTLADLRARGEAGKLGLDDVKGATFTLTNAGMVPAARWTTPIIPLGQTAILGVGGVRKAPVVRQEQVVPGWVLPLSLTFDHAAINGFPASTFLDDLADKISDPRQTIATLAASNTSNNIGKNKTNDD